MLVHNLVRFPANHYIPRPSTTPTSGQTNQPQSSTRISFVENPYTFEERHASLSEPLIPAIRQAPLSEPQTSQHLTSHPHFNKTLTEAKIQAKTKI